MQGRTAILDLISLPAFYQAPEKSKPNGLARLGYEELRSLYR
jgi:hypothetical protein